MVCFATALMENLARMNKGEFLILLSVSLLSCAGFDFCPPPYGVPRCQSGAQEIVVFVCDHFILISNR